MTHFEPSPAAPQRTITVSIVGTDEHAKVFYSYWSPIFGTSFVNSPSCDMKIDRPTYSLFVLDYQSSLAGWSFVKTGPDGASEQLKFQLGPENLSLSTYNPYTTDHDIYPYFLYFKNVNGAQMKDDPQEGNIPR